mmetsp:Transcript_2101/g.3157  ORF Transcript_2101/g.3157 Transcript_2101/m.3157 type:complete len:277 (+) Transcript_2101:517-1347(+)
MKIGISTVSVLGIRFRHIVINDNINALDIDTTTDEISGHKNALLTLLKALVNIKTIFLRHASINADRREIAVVKQLVEGLCALHRFDENNNLVKVKSIEKIVKLAILLVFVNHQIMLNQTVEGKLRFIIDDDFGGVIHELLAESPHFIINGCREHHNLLVVGRKLKDELDIGTHIQFFEHFIAFVKYEVTNLLEYKVFHSGELLNPTRRPNNNIRSVFFQLINLSSDGNTTVEVSNTEVPKPGAEPFELVADLIGKLTGVAEDDGLNNSGLRIDLL